ncbi:MAG: hypothetical protein ACD_15C00152G0003 [uncultured bacterium]|nr:MAG: hypothetical protein ACD_15C00152G0003 [uncultured bacterium]
MIISVFAPINLVRAETPDHVLKNLVEKITKTELREYGQIDNSKNNQKEVIKKSKKKVPAEITDVKEVERQAEFASQVTGVRKEFLMGMLVVESDLGKNTGECTYQEVKEGAENAYKNGLLSEQAWQTFKKRKKIIQDIANDLGYDDDKLKVSCNPDYAGTGGAMGIPQFMPDTWMEYKDELAQILGKENPDPWNVRDGVLAMALKVADVPGVVEHNVWAERNASKMYLSGTTSYQYDWYASRIQYWANNYKSLIG